MSTVIDFAQDLHERQVDAAKKGADALLGVATKLVDAQETLQNKLHEVAPKVPEAIHKLVEPVESFFGVPGDYAKWIEATDAEWDKLRRRYNGKVVDLLGNLAPKVDKTA